MTPVNSNAILRAGIHILFYSCVAIIAWVVLQVFFLASFKVPTGSMEPEIWPGDYLLVSKPTYGARLFNLFPTLRLEQVNIYRAPGWRKVRRNDVVVFNNPYPHTPERMEMHILKYFVKRCIGLPGDSLRIENGQYRVKGLHPENRPGRMLHKPVPCYPNDPAIQWNTREFGPLYIPARGDTLAMNRHHYILYKTLIERETKGRLTLRDTAVYLNNRPLPSHIFHSDYYFMAGDNASHSQDSRHWGLVPGEYIAGKAWLIWKSVDPHTGTFRRERRMKIIH
ncbi:MAG: signal peptidase I [Tannerella sp.]|jgi:signal peptidase I|nr:signal peptidase I [Tannerella sp.]